MVNQDIRQKVFIAEISYRDIAKRLGFRANYLSRIMRYPLSDRNRKRIEEAVDEIIKEKGKS